MESMSTVREYRGLSYGDIALETFSAGHDLLLFGHMSSDISDHSEFKLEDLREAIDRIESFAQTSEGRRRLELSLEKILTFKKKIRDKVNVVSPSKFNIELNNIFDNTGYAGGSDFVQSVFDGSIVLLSKNDSFQGFDLIERLSSHEKLNIFGKRKYLDSLQDLSGRKNVEVIEKENYEKKGRVLKIEKYRDKLVSSLNGSKVVFFADNKDDMEVVKYVYLYESQFISNLYVVVAESPDLVPDEFINQINIVVVFSQDSRIGKSIGRLLSGSVRARPISYMPMDVSNGSYFDAKDRNPLINVGDEPVQIFKSASEQHMYEQMLELRKHYWSLIFFIFIPWLIIFTVLIYIVSAYYATLHAEVKRRDVLKALNPLHWVPQHPVLTTVLVALVSVVVITVNPDSKAAIILMENQPEWLNEYIQEIVEQDPIDVTSSTSPLIRQDYVSSDIY
jgi:hypothetical protein